MAVPSSSTIPRLFLFLFACVVLLAASFASGAARRVSAQVEADETGWTIAARICPDGYDGVAYAEDCVDPVAGFAFDLAGPADAEVITGDDGLADAGTVPLGSYAVEALDFEPDDGFVVACGRPSSGGPFPVDIAYTDAGFEIDLDAEFGRDIPPVEPDDDTVTCTWYVLPEPVSEERPGIVALVGGGCEDDDAAAGIVAVEPGGETAEFNERQDSCPARPVEVVLTNDESGAETTVEAAADAETGYTLAAVPAGTYAASVDGEDVAAPFGVDSGEATVVLAVVPARTLTATLNVPPTAAAVPEQDPQPLAAIEFGPGDWRDSFPNINIGVYDRAAVAVYGSLSPFPTASLRFDLPSTPAGDATLTIEGLADELGPANIAITVNGEEVYRGPSGFASWDPSAASPAWTPVDFAIPAGSLQAGGNEITVANLAESAAFGVPPYVLLSVATLTFAE